MRCDDEAVRCPVARLACFGLSRQASSRSSHAHGAATALEKFSAEYVGGGGEGWAKGVGREMCKGGEEAWGVEAVVVVWGGVGRLERGVGE